MRGWDLGTRLGNEAHKTQLFRTKILILLFQLTILKASTSLTTVHTIDWVFSSVRGSDKNEHAYIAELPSNEIFLLKPKNSLIYGTQQYQKILLSEIVICVTHIQVTVAKALMNDKFSDKLGTITAL